MLSRLREKAQEMRRRLPAPGPVGVVQFLLFVLQLVQTVINSTLRKQFLVSTLFAQPAFVKYQDPVGVLNRAQAMRDDQRGPPE